jgi:CPA2 family monovalent cation:H+ antiporter-2
VALAPAVGWVALILVLIAIAKAGSAYAILRVLRLPDVSAWQVSTGLAEIGEFSFVLAGVALAEQLVPPEAYTAILACVVLTISASTVLVRVRTGTPTPNTA